MAVTAKRFEFLDKETNVGITDFISVTDSSIRNIVRESTTGVESAIASIASPINTAVSTVKDKASSAIKEALSGTDLEGFNVDEIFRESRNLLGVTADIKNLPNKAVDRIAEGMFPGNSSARSLAKSLFKTCGVPGSGFGNMRPFGINLDCNGNSLGGGKGACAASGMSNILNALTNGAYNKSISDINSLINGAVSLATGSYNANLCGGFNASITGLSGNKSAVTRAGVMTMIGLASTHNARANMEIATEVDTAGVNLQYPNATKTVVGSPSIDKSYYGRSGVEPFMNQFGQDSRYSNNIYQGIVDTAGLLDSSWDKNSAGGLSLQKIVDSTLTSTSKNSGFSNLAKSKLNSNGLNLSSLNTVNSNALDSLSLAYVSL